MTLLTKLMSEQIFIKSTIAIDLGYTHTAAAVAVAVAAANASQW